VRCERPCHTHAEGGQQFPPSDGDHVVLAVRVPNKTNYSRDGFTLP
jgi:hypothetical protein